MEIKHRHGEKPPITHMFTAGFYLALWSIKRSSYFCGIFTTGNLFYRKEIKHQI